MFRLLRVFHETKKLVDIANREAAKYDGEGPRFSFWLTNRSFLVPALVLLLNVLVLFQVPFLMPLVEPVIAYMQATSPDVLAEHIGAITITLGLVWAAMERLLGRTRVLWNRKQGIKAVEEAVTVVRVERDRLQEALDQALKTPVKAKR